MFNFTFSVTGNIQLEKAWQLYSNVSEWSKWDSDIESIILEGDFVTDNAGIIKMKNGQTLPFTLKDVFELQSFTSVSHLEGITIEFGHFIQTDNNNNSTITHTVTISGGDEKQMEGMGKGITANIQKSMEQLLCLSK